jgi:hypothetical protein
MSHEVEYTRDIEAWWQGLTAQERADTAKVVDLLAAGGLDRVHRDSRFLRVENSAHLRELYIPSAPHPLRIFYALDPRPAAVLLAAGRRSEQDRFYSVHVLRANAIYHEHLQELERERRLKREGRRSRPWRALFERLPASTRDEVREHTVRVLAELDRAGHESGGVGQGGDTQARTTAYPET